VIAALYDIHGNLPALEAVLAELHEEPPEAVVIGGDVAAGPQPVEVLGRLRALPWPVHWLRGNADRFVVMCWDGTLPAELADHPYARADTWTAGRMPRADRDLLASLPPLVRLGDVLFCHGSPRSDEERLTVFTPPARVDDVVGDERLVVCGHTHRQFDLGRLVNAGSVGRPNEREPAAYWATLRPSLAPREALVARESRAIGGKREPGARPAVELRRTDYDTEAATARFVELGYPIAEEMLSPKDADAIARRYEDAAGAPVAPESLTA
jgi:predicted phosphodiesterase